MTEFGERKEFPIRPTIEHQPFLSPPVQSFFSEWCRINDSIKPEFISRVAWILQSKELLVKNSDNSRTLYLPEDLKLWEMVGVIEAVDHDTFKDNPQRRDEAKNQLLMLGKTFQNAGTYIAQRIESITQGRTIAENLAKELYGYGASLATGKPPRWQTLDAIAALPLSSAETEIVDRFLAGETLYKARKSKAEDAEAMRRSTLAQFFRVSEKAFQLDAKRLAQVPELPPWIDNAPIHRTFLEHVEKALKTSIKLPKTELTAAIFRRGMELLRTSMPMLKKDATFIDRVFKRWANGEKPLRKAIGIDRLKKKLERIRLTGNREAISREERQIADVIQSAVSMFSRNEANIPVDMVITKCINCVGASMIGGTLMQEAGLTYLVGQVPEHSLLFLVTADGNVEWRDMLDPKHNEKLQDRMIAGKNADGSPLTVADIVAFAKNPSPKGLLFDMTTETYRKKLPWVKKRQRQLLGLFGAEYGQKNQVLINTGVTLSQLGFPQQAEEAFRQVIALNPQNPYAYYNLGHALKNMNRNHEALTAYRRAISINPLDDDCYTGLGNTLLNLGLHEEGVRAYQQAISLNPESVDPYYDLGSALSALGKNEEAVSAYKQFIIAARREKRYESFIEFAEQKIQELESKPKP